MSASVARATEQAARLVRVLGVGEDVGAAASVLVVGCQLQVSWVTEPAARLVRGLGVGLCLWCLLGVLQLFLHGFSLINRATLFYLF